MELGRIIFRGEEVWRAYKNREIIWHQKKLKFFSAKDIEIFALSCCELKNESTDSIHSQFGMLIDLEWLSFFLDRSKNVGRKTSADILENFQINSDLTKIRQADNIFSVLDDWRLNPSTSGKIEKRLPILNINSWSLFLDESAILKKTEEIELYLKNLFALFPTKKIEKKERITSVYLKNCFASLAKPEWIKASISSLSLI